MLYLVWNICYKINLNNFSDTTFTKIFINTFKINNILLEIEPDSINRAFPINEKINCKIEKYSDSNFICKNEKEFFRILGQNKLNFFLNFSIDARKANQIYLKTAVVFYKYDNSHKKYSLIF